MHPILFYLGSLPIGTYGVAIVCGMFGALWLLGRLARRRGMPVDFFYDLLFRLLIFGFLGARLFYIVQNWGEFMNDPFGVLFSRQGFVFQGGFLAALAAGVYFSLKQKMPLLEVTDIVAPALALAHGFGRIGCFFAGCCYGKACPPGHVNTLERLLSVRYPLNLDHGQMSPFNFAYQSQLDRGLIFPGATHTLPLLPVQLFESFGNFVICLILLWAWRRRRFSGQIFALYMLLYSVLRFGLEFLRGDLERGIYFGLPTGQIIALGTFAAGVTLWAARHNRGVVAVPEMANTETTPCGMRNADCGSKDSTGGPRPGKEAPKAAKKKR